MTLHFSLIVQVVASIHQPNSDITACFNDLLLLANGKCIYYGPWQSSVQYFASVGFSCPHYTNCADYYLAISKDSADVLTDSWEVNSHLWWEDDLLATNESLAPGKAPDNLSARRKTLACTGKQVRERTKAQRH